MSSLIPDYEYDIFISYRHNDNLDGWVTNFVESLEKELRGTIKESVSVYFDSNPHDGLLETHNVGKSLEGKLKCLIFIPILSQTYCDPKSFAWQHEFVAFNKLTEADQFGRDIKLNNGNVASRILPIKIHELDTEDKAIIENEIGGALRAIEFIYKEPGVNRSLIHTDRKSENQNKTDYRNQVNKAANAIKEILVGLMKPSSAISVAPKDPTPVSIHEALDSIAVLPFANMSSDPEQEYFSDGISEEIINVLAQLKNLKVAGRTSSFTFKGKNEDLRIVGDKLGVKTVLEGSVRKSGNRIRITAQLINVENGFHLWSERYDRDMKDIFEIQDEIALAIVEELKLKLFEEGRTHSSKSKTQNMEAYNYYLKGRFYWNKNRSKEGLEKTMRCFEQSIKIDPMYALAFAGLADAYAVAADWGFLETKIAVEKIDELYAKARELDDDLTDNHFALLYKACLEWDWPQAEIEGRKAIQANPESPRVHHVYALLQMISGNFKIALEHNRLAQELEPLALIFKFARGMFCYMARQYEDAIKQYQNALELDSSFAPAHFWSTFCNLQRGLNEEAVQEYQNLLLCSPNTQKYVPVVLTIFKESGVKGFLHWLVDEGIGLHVGTYNQSYHRAVCYALLNEKEQAFEAIAKAYEEHSFRLGGIKVEPGFDSLRDDPRFLIYLEKVRSA